MANKKKESNGRHSTGLMRDSGENPLIDDFQQADLSSIENSIEEVKKK
jgi:hypothetical protein